MVAPSWQAIGPDQMPGAREGEGGFAASGTTAMVAPGGRAWFVTGGTGGGRVFRSTDWGRTWQVAQTPVAHDSAASGIFSIAFRDRLHGVVVGGDYSKPSESRANAAVSADGGATWTAPGGPLPHGYRSAVFFFPGTDHAVAVGTSGTDLSHGWRAIVVRGGHG